MDLSALPRAGELSPHARAARWRPGLAVRAAQRDLRERARRQRRGAGAGAGARRRRAGGGPSAACCGCRMRAALRLTGRPYRPGLPAALRGRVIHVAAATPEDALFALEEGLRCRELACVIGEIAGNPQALDFTASRRLSLAAERHGVPLFLVRLDAARDLSRGADALAGRAPRLRRRRAGTRRRPALPPGAPSCSAPARPPSRRMDPAR